MKTQIEGVLNGKPIIEGGPLMAFWCSDLIGVWVLICDESLLPALRGLVGKRVLINGEPVATINQHGGVFKVDSVFATTRV